MNHFTCHSLSSYDFHLLTASEKDKPGLHAAITMLQDFFVTKIAEEVDLQVVTAGFAGVSSLLLLASTARCRRRRKRKEREVRVSDLLSKREVNGAYNKLMAELRVDDPNAFRRYLRMNCSDIEVMV